LLGELCHERHFWKIEAAMNNMRVDAVRCNLHMRVANRVSRLLTACLVSLIVACGRHEPSRELRPEPPMPRPGSDRAATLVAVDASTHVGSRPPLQGDWIETLTLADGSRAFVTPPALATDSRPVVVAIHGAVDDPGLMCSAWRLVVDVFAFVVCPAGGPYGSSDRLKVWPSSARLVERIDATLVALRAKYGAYVAPPPYVYAAFSQGANYAANVFRARSHLFARAVLTEGGAKAFVDPSTCAQTKSAGIERVLFSCSQSGCAHGFGGGLSCLRGAGVEADLVDSGPLGHSMPPPVRAALNRELPRIVAGLDSWAGYANAKKLPDH
jgi:hypothetical protein